jgi:TonB family protein
MTYAKLAAACAIATAAAAAAQLSGRIYDPSGAVAPGARVSLRDSKTGTESETSSGPAGEYRFAAVAAGSYDLSVAAPGFVRYARRRVRLGDTPAVSIGAILQLGEVLESMTVETKGAAKPPASRAPERIRVGGNVQPLRMLQQVKPEYPESARAEGREGNVVLRAAVGLDGSVVNARALPGADRDLASAAEAALRQWRFQPTLLNGQAVETAATVEINFRLTP